MKDCWPYNLFFAILGPEIYSNGKILSTLEIASSKDCVDGLMFALSSIEKTEERVLFELYKDGLTYEKVGERHGFHAGKARQIELLALKSLNVSFRLELCIYGLNGFKKRISLLEPGKRFQQLF